MLYKVTICTAMISSQFLPSETKMDIFRWSVICLLKYITGLLMVFLFRLPATAILPTNSTLHFTILLMQWKWKARYWQGTVVKVYLKFLKIFGNGPQPCSSDSNPVFGFWNSDYFKKRWIVASLNLLKQVGFRVATKLLCWTWSVTGLIFFSGAKTFPIAKNVAYNSIKSVLEKLFKV